MKNIAILLLVSMLISCTNQENNKKLANIERIMLAYPDSAFTLLQKDSASICEMGKDAQMHYQSLCSESMICNISHTRATA